MNGLKVRSHFFGVSPKLDQIRLRITDCLAVHLSSFFLPITNTISLYQPERWIVLEDLWQFFISKKVNNLIRKKPHAGPDGFCLPEKTGYMQLTFGIEIVKSNPLCGSTQGVSAIMIKTPSLSNVFSCNGYSS